MFLRYIYLAEFLNNSSLVFQIDKGNRSKEKSNEIVLTTLSELLLFI